MMQHTMVISEEELDILNDLLHAELGESRTEYRHTDDHEYRERIQRRIQTVERFLQKVDVARVYAGTLDPSGRFITP
ncbi:MAG: hypothetical protein JW849_10985 [Phycisphaerae bacterium]|nr:hypothetical protein [Phycisphaerae bacterium]